MKILIIVAHPDLKESKVNAIWKERLEQEDNVTVHDLYNEYPTGEIDVEKEQGLLLEHDRILLQFPFYWFSTPSLLKKWQDEVYKYGFAYGTGNKLKGKEYGLLISAGKPEESYTPEGSSKHSMEQFLLPLSATVLLTEMKYLQPFILYSAPHISEKEIRESAENLVEHVSNPN